MKTTNHLILKATTCFQGVKIITPTQEAAQISKSNLLAKSKALWSRSPLLSASREKQQSWILPAAGGYWTPTGLQSAASQAHKAATRENTKALSDSTRSQRRSQEVQGSKRSGDRRTSRPLSARSAYILCSNTLETGLGATAPFPSTGLHGIVTAIHYISTKTTHGPWS